jgi:hypothetical protein
MAQLLQMAVLVALVLTGNLLALHMQVAVVAERLMVQAVLVARAVVARAEVLARLQVLTDHQTLAEVEVEHIQLDTVQVHLSHQVVEVQVLSLFVTLEHSAALAARSHHPADTQFTHLHLAEHSLHNRRSTWHILQK